MPHHPIASETLTNVSRTPLDFEATLCDAFAFLDQGSDQDFLTVSKQMVMSKSYTPSQITVDGQMETYVKLKPGDIYGYMTSFGSYGKFHVESVEPEIVISFETY